MDTNPLLLKAESSGDDKAAKKEQIRCWRDATWFNKLTFGWIFNLISFSNQQEVKQDNLQDLTMEDQCQSVYGQWNSHWETQLKTNKDNPLMKSIRQTFFKRYFVSSISDFLAYQFTILTPVIVYFLLHMLEDRPSNMRSWEIFFLFFIPLVRFMRSFFDAQGIYHLGVLGNDISNCVALGMVNKSLRYSTLCNKKFKLGQISSLMQVDCFRLSLLPKSFNGILFVSYVLVFSIIFMALLVGPAFLAGFGVLALALGANMIISKTTTKNQKEVASATDNRMKITNQIFNSIKFIKVNAWQQYFYDKLINRRNEQVGWFRKKFLSESYSTYSMWLTPKLVLAAIFGTYVGMGNELRPPIAFAIMMLYGYIQFYLQYLPNYISVSIECFNSLKRIQSFLLAEEIDTSCITYNQYQSDRPNAIQVQNGNFYWDKDSSELGPNMETPLTLTDHNYIFKKGQMVAIMGDIGSGKSSVMYSLLGQMKFRQNLPTPRVTVNGTISLVTQKPWIVNDTVKNNILFGKPYNKKKYDEIIHYACLKRDFQLFTHGDKTMIGQKGATLSGGQKARISFARSLYSQSDILMLDDLLSAVDVHVGKFMMTQTLLQFCRSKTRILITHALYYLKYVDKILIMENGKIVEQGNYEIIRNSARFQDIYNNMMKDDKKAKKDSIDLLEIDVAQKDDQQIQNNKEALENLITNEIIKEVSIHSKNSRTQSAVDRDKLQKLRAKKSQAPSKKPIVIPQVVKQQEKESASSKNMNQLMMAEQSGGNIGFGLYKSFAKYNGGISFIGLIFLIQLLWTAANAISNLWLAKWSQRFSQTDPKISNSQYLGVYIAIGISYGTFAFFRALLIAYASPKMSLFIHQSMISNLLFSSLNEFFDRVPLGRIFNRLSKDLNSVDNNIPNYFNNTLVFVFFALTNIIIVLVIAPIYVFLPIIIFYLICCHLLHRYTSAPQRDLTRLEGFTKSPIVSCFTQILSGVTTVRCYNVKQMFFQKNCQKINENKKPVMLRKACQVWFTFRLTLVSFIINFSALIYILFFLTKSDDSAAVAAQAGLIVLATLAFDEIMYFLYVNLSTFSNELISIERCQSFMNLQPEKGYIQYLKNRQQLKIKSRQRRIMKQDGWPDRGRIDFIDYKCRYRANLDLVLRGLTVTFQGGHKIGVVGRTGSGKSTIMLCLLRILEASDGKIILDGKDISQLSLDDLRSKITIILQDPCLFAGTIRQNLDPLHQYSDEHLTSCLQLCALKELIANRSGLETQISENGQNLSAGQRQLVSICRAILKPTRIVLVDQATANIDVRTQSVIYRAMNESFKNSTVITVAHRLNTVINSDRILVLQGGMLKQFDNPRQLLKNPNSFFAQLYNQSQKQNKM